MTEEQQHIRRSLLQRRQLMHPFLEHEMQLEVQDTMRYINAITQEIPATATGGTEPMSSAAEDQRSSSSSSPPATPSSTSSFSSLASFAPSQAEGITTLASQLANTSVTQSLSQVAAEVESTSSLHPSLIVSNIQAERQSQPASGPHVIVRDIVDLGNGQSVVLPIGAAANQMIRTEQAPSPKERRNIDDEESVPHTSPSTSGSSASASHQPASQSQAALPYDPPHQQLLEEEIKEKLVQELLTFILQYCRYLDPLDLVHKLRKLPSATLESIYKDLVRRELRLVQSYDPFQAGYPRQQQNREKGPLSDEESDEELMKKEAMRPSQATFQLTSTQTLTRCLILGSPSQIRVTPSRDLNAVVSNCIRDLIKEDSGEQAVEILKDISTKGRSSRQDTILFCLAFCCRNGNLKTKQAAYAAIQEICRIPTHLFQLIDFIEKGGETTGWGRGLRKAMRQWYNSNATNPLHLAMHVTKYASRHGWSHRDIFRLSHIKPVNDVIGFIVRYCVKGMKEAEEEFLQDGYLERTELEKVHKYLQAVEEAKKCEDSTRTVQLIQEHDLVREQLRTDMLNRPEVWAVMLPKMPLFALMRNLNKMTAIQLFDNQENVDLVVSKLTNTNAMRKARIHPLKLLLTHRMYQRGQGDKGSLHWQPHQQIVETLEKAFYDSFDAVEPTNKRILIALDISGSMDSAFPDYPFTIREASTVMAMVTARKEPLCDVVGFHHKLIPLDIFKDDSKKLEQLTTETRQMGFGSTDCSKPMTWARKHKKEYDAFIIYTDSETNTHRITPYQALQKYRKQMNLPNAKFVVVGMSGHEFSVANPEDINSMDVVGFDPDTPDTIRGFLNGEFDP